MANSVNLLRNYQKIFPLQNFDNETYNLRKLQKYSVETAFVTKVVWFEFRIAGKDKQC
jgi:hypothetical protein